jgi:type IV fimbrial biogenesis protein FimT
MISSGSYTSARAFTLIELLITITVIAVLLFIAIPSWHGIVLKNRSLAEADKIVNALQFAHAEAISSGNVVKFCKSKNFVECCSNDCAWTDGQLVMLSGSRHIIGTFAALPSGDKLTWQSSFGSNDFIAFSPFGTTTGQQGSFYYCPSGAKEYALAVIVQQTGHIRVSNRTADGKQISCSTN